ncbi:hypothetical protein Hanom_Chr09g00825001 [Helianthus anomalus]
MSPRVRTRQGEFTAELAWSGSGSQSGITPTVGRTVHYTLPPTLNCSLFFIFLFYLKYNIVLFFYYETRSVPGGFFYV